MPGTVRLGFQAPGISELKGRKHQTQDKAHPGTENMTKRRAAKQSLLPKQEAEEGQVSGKRRAGAGGEDPMTDQVGN